MRQDLFEQSSFVPPYEDQACLRWWNSLRQYEKRPKKDGLYNSYAGAPGTGGRLDPTNEMFLKTEDREGGPVDPMTSFEDNVNLLF